MVNGRRFALGAIGGAGVSVQLALAGRAVASTGSATEEASQSGIGVRAGSRSAVWAPQDRDGQKQVLLPAVENAALAPS
jgi:hypothetical protein